MAYIAEEFTEPLNFLYPLNGEGVVSSPYGIRINPISGEQSMHEGVDIAADTGTEIVAALDGEITYVGDSPTFGIFVFYQCGEYQITCAHMSKASVSIGETVSKGQVIGLVGSTGNSTGPHLHFEISMAGETVDPRDYITLQ